MCMGAGVATAMICASRHAEWCHQTWILWKYWSFWLGDGYNWHHGAIWCRLVWSRLNSQYSSILLWYQNLATLVSRSEWSKGIYTVHIVLHGSVWKQDTHAHIYIYYISIYTPQKTLATHQFCCETGHISGLHIPVWNAPDWIYLGSSIPLYPRHSPSICISTLNPSFNDIHTYACTYTIYICNFMYNYSIYICNAYNIYPIDWCILDIYIWHLNFLTHPHGSFQDPWFRLIQAEADVLVLHGETTCGRRQTG